MKSTLLAALLALCAASASAQTMYTTVSPDGHKTFSDRADPTPEPVAEAAPAKAIWRTPTGTMAKGSRGAALVNASEAERRLLQTRKTRSKGMALLPGESDMVPGGTLVNARYWNRQERLELDVERAQSRANEVRQLTLAQR
jgi:hypothetical protein